MDIIGVRRGLFIFSLTVTFGQIIFFIGGWKIVYWVMLLGRFVFGLFWMSLKAAQLKILNNWFRGKELSLAGNTFLCIARLSSVAIGYSVPYVTEKFGLTQALFIGVIICLWSFLNTIGIICLDQKQQNSLQNEKGGPSKKVNC